MSGRGRTRTWTWWWSLLLVYLVEVLHNHQICAEHVSGEVIPTEIVLESGVQVQLAVLDYANTGFRGTWSNPVLQSPNGRYQFSLQLADMGHTHVCWVAVVDTVNRTLLRWRAPCSVSVGVESCNLIATAEGDMQFLTGSGRVAWQTNTTAMGVQVLQLDDIGNFMMKSKDGLVVWVTADFPASPPCLRSGPLDLNATSNSEISPSPSPGSMADTGAAASMHIMIICCIVPLLTFSLLGFG